MHKRRHRPAAHPRPFLVLETLEDRRLFSVGGLLSQLAPHGPAPTAAAPLTALVQNLDVAPLLAPVTTAVEGVSGAAVGGVVQTVASVVPAVTVDLGLMPAAPASSPPPSVLDAALAGLAPVTTTVLDVVGAVVGGVGNVVRPAAPASAPTGGLDLNLLGVNLNVDLALLAPESGQPAPTVGLGIGVDPPAGGLLNVDPPAGGSGGVAPTVGAPVGGTDGPPANSVPGAPAAEPSSGGAGVPLTAAPPSAATPDVAPAPNADVGRLLAASTPAEPAGAAAVIAVDATPTDAGHPVAPPAVVAPAVTALDGGAGVVADDSASVIAPAASLAAGNGGAADRALPPVSTDAAADDQAGANPAPEASGLTTRFQPVDLGALARGLADLAARLTPARGGWAAWVGRWPHLGPWLIGILFAGTTYEVRRRRRQAAKAAAQPFGE